jgi:hypothetical protein
MVTTVSTANKFEFRRLQSETADLWATGWHAANHGVKAERMTKEEVRRERF